MKQPSFTSISSASTDPFKYKKNLDLADPSHKHSYFNRNDKTFHIKFPVPNEDFGVYFITNDTEADDVMPVITLHISDKTPNEAIGEDKEYIAYTTFTYDEITSYLGIDFDLNKTTEIKVIIFNDESVANKKSTPIFTFESEGMVGHFYEINASNIAELSDFKLNKTISDQLDIAELPDFKIDEVISTQLDIAKLSHVKLYGARVNNNIIEAFVLSRPREFGGGVIVGR